MLVMWEITGRYRSIGEAKMVENSWKSYPYNLKKKRCQRELEPLKIANQVVAKDCLPKREIQAFETAFDFALQIWRI